MPVSKLPEVTLPDGQVVQVIQPLIRNLPAGFSAWPPATQRNAIRALEEFLQEVRRNGSIEHMSELGLINPGQAILDQRPPDSPQLKLDLIDRCSWQLAQLLRYSNPTRISEAIGPLRVVLEGYNRIYGGPAKDAVPTLYFAVALSKTPGQEERALREFQDGLNHIAVGPEAPVKNLLWAKSNLARLLRHLNRVSQAEEQEEFIRDWVIGHPYAFPPSEIRAIIQDETDNTGAHIVDHPILVEYFNSINELGPGVAYDRRVGVFLTYGAYVPPV